MRLRLVARGREQAVEDSRDLVSVPEHDRQRGAVAGGIALATESELGLGDDLRERCAELVRQLRREALLAADAVAKAVEQPVQCGCEQRQLVVRLAEVEAAMKIVLAPGGGLRGHPSNGLECRT